MKGSEITRRWAIYIDIEGFSVIYEQDITRALLSLGGLMEDIFKIGNSLFPEPPERLFAHQLGDGFVIISDFVEQSLERPISIAVALLQSTLLRGGTARAGISEGDFADIRGCYPDLIKENRNDDGILRLGHGILTTFNVMGSALIRAVKITKKIPKGPCLLIDLNLKHKVPADIFPSINETNDTLELNWFITHLNGLNKIHECLEIDPLDTNILAKNMKDYLSNSASSSLSKEWKASANRLIKAVQSPLD